MSSSPPRTIRRKSVGPAPINVNTNENDEIFGFSVKLRLKLLKEFTVIQRLFEAKIVGSNDPDYPRSELVQQLKHSSLAMYQTSKLVCETICDVAETSPIILFGFLIGLQSLLHAAWSSVHPGSENPLIGQLVEQFLQKARFHGVTDVEFTIDNLDGYIEKLVELFDFRNEGIKRTTSIPNVINTPTKKTMKVIFGGSVSAERQQPDIVHSQRVRAISIDRSSVSHASLDDSSFASVENGVDDSPPAASFIPSPTSRSVLEQLMIAVGNALGDLDTPESIGEAIDMVATLTRKVHEGLGH